LSVAAGGDVPSLVLAAFAATFREVEVTLTTYSLDRPAAGLLDFQTDGAFVRMPVVADGIEFRELAREPRVPAWPS
jgi:DNA-binding transcriptional LysR family regulator